MKKLLDCDTVSQFRLALQKGERHVQNLRTVSQVSGEFGVSTRMLRYYEQLGLINSSRKDGYAYRVYEEREVVRLRQILLLRKLRIPLKEIGQILQDPTAVSAIAVFERSLEGLEEELEAVSAVRDVLADLTDALKARYWLPAEKILLDDDGVLELVDSLSPSKTTLQEESVNKMEALERSEQVMGRLKNVRIIHLPETAVAAAHFVGDDPENHVGAMIADFVRSTRLWERHPGLRSYGFNHPNPVDETNYHGYEMWVTIPEDLDVPKPLVKKRFPGGLYAAHCIRMGDFHEWAWLDRWVRENGEYVYNGSGSPENMFGSLEEHLNYFTAIQETQEGEPPVSQLDLLIPVRRKSAQGENGNLIPGGTFS